MYSESYLYPVGVKILLAGNRRYLVFSRFQAGGEPLKLANVSYRQGNESCLIEECLFKYIKSQRISYRRSWECLASTVCCC